MKKLGLLCAALISPSVVTAAPDAPFAPLPNTPDYVVTVFVKLYHGPTYQERRTHRHGWTRIDGSFDRRHYRSTSYFGPGPLFVTFAYEPSAQVEGHDWLHIMRGPAMAHLVRWGDNPFKTDEWRATAGENCEVWNLSRRFVRAGAKHLSCVTPDGIELWSRVENDFLPGTSFEVTEIKRLLVNPDDVRPPRARLELKSWLTADGGTTPSADAPRDATVVLQSQPMTPGGRAVQTRTVMRHYPWTYTEDVYGDGRRTLLFRNETELLDITFESNAAGEPIRLSIMKALKRFDRSTQQPGSGQAQIFGEECTRFEIRHRHGRSSQCRTADGLVLEESNSGKDGSYALSAVRLERSAVNPAAVLPPPFIFEPKTWSIPD